MNQNSTNTSAHGPATPNISSALIFVLRALCLLWFSAANPVLGKEKPSFTDYDVPLYEQIVDRIQDKVSARLGKGRLARDRYFIVPFAYENEGNDPEFSHSFITVIRVIAEGKRALRPDDHRTGKYKRWNFEAYNISWIPNDFLENPHLCVFHGVGSRLFPSLNECPVSVGKCFSLDDTIKMASNARVAVGMWGPYEITKQGFDLGVKRKQLLDSGRLKYRADDRGYREKKIAINCFHAMAGLDELFPNGGIFGTGFKMWGLNGTSRVLIEYSTQPSNKGVLLEPVNAKKDRYGFVYAPAREDRRVYNPFKVASAYHR
jgi:hypothetical protein